MTTYLTQGDTVDIMDDETSKTVVIAQNVAVLENAGGIVVLKVTDAQALELAGSSDNSKLWLILRPPTGATESVRVGSQEGNL